MWGGYHILTCRGVCVRIVVVSMLTESFCWRALQAKTRHSAPGWPGQARRTGELRDALRHFCFTFPQSGKTSCRSRSLPLANRLILSTSPPTADQHLLKMNARRPNGYVLPTSPLYACRPWLRLTRLLARHSSLASPCFPFGPLPIPTPSFYPSLLAYLHTRTCP